MKKGRNRYGSRGEENNLIWFFVFKDL